MESLKDKIKSGSDFPTQCRKFAVDIDNMKGHRRRMAVIASYTTMGFRDCLKTKAYAHDLLVDVYEGQYSQWRQEILGNQLYEYDPEVIFVFVDPFGMENEMFFEYGVTDFDMRKYSDQQFEELWKYIAVLKEKTSAKIIIANAVKPQATALGALEGKVENSLCMAIDEFNRRLFETARSDSQIYIFDLDRWLGLVGKKGSWCDKFFFVADMKIEPSKMPALSEELMRYLVPLFGKKKKCIVLDLDNTLWGGIVGEDGIGGIKLGPTGEGQPFFYFQRLLLHLKRRGFLLAICSKNNESDAKEVFAKHPHMVLKEDDFVSTKIDWNDKATNIKAIAEELNIGLDSLVFIDDDPTNTLSVKQILKEVDVITLPKDPTEYISIVLDYKGLGGLEYTDEDSKRTDMYKSDKKRKELQSVAVDMESFLKDLNISLTIKPVDEVSLQRSAQLTQKTNQFNLTTFRYTEEDIKKMMSTGHRLWTLEVEDRFGHYGIVGLCIARDSSDYWEIDTLLMSCRVLGRKIEFDFFGHIVKELHRSKPKKIRGRYIPTAKNVQVKDFYRHFNFIRATSADDSDVWELDHGSYKFSPSGFINIKT